MRKVIIILITLSLFVTGLPQAEEKPEEYINAVEEYANGRPDAAMESFKRVAEKYPGTQYHYDALLYMAKIWLSRDVDEKAAAALREVIDRNPGTAYALEAAGELAKIEAGEAISDIKRLIKKTDIDEVRIKAFQKLAELSSRIDGKYADENIDFMLNMLKSEKDMEMASAISRAIYSMGRLSAERLERLYRKADGFMKEKLLLLISMYDDEDLIMSLQNETEEAGGAVRNFILWALAKMDPYRFAQSFEGRLSEEEGRYFLKTEAGRRELFASPALKSASSEILDGSIGKKIKIYGIEVEEGIIYTDFFNRD